MNFEQEVLWKLGRLEERSETQTKLLEALNRDGCAQGHADRERLNALELERSVVQFPAKRTSPTVWAAIGTMAGSAVIWIAQWLGFKAGGGTP